MTIYKYVKNMQELDDNKCTDTVDIEADSFQEAEKIRKEKGYGWYLEHDDMTIEQRIEAMTEGLAHVYVNTVLSTDENVSDGRGTLNVEQINRHWSVLKDFLRKNEEL